MTDTQKFWAALILGMLGGILFMVVTLAVSALVNAPAVDVPQPTFDTTDLGKIGVWCIVHSGGDGRGNLDEGHQCIAAYLKERGGR